MRVSVSADGMVVVDGVGAACAVTLPSGVRALHWDGEVGFEERDAGSTPVDLDAFGPYLAAWRQATGREAGRWRVLRSTLIERMTEQEAVDLSTIVATLPVRDRLLWEAARWLWNDDARVLGAAAAMSWSDARVAELLAYDPDARMLQG
ncbi:hypothetical protein [Elioraea sp.]|uniref:hypothetical protein n=1 Tax=Elioraea sp. TaxID=2185103 RepID=UPI0025B980C1|nr:hypothetical protein [Elioraea sp.]